jgi:hypothetical protein
MKRRACKPSKIKRAGELNPDLELYPEASRWVNISAVIIIPWSPAGNPPTLLMMHIKLGAAKPTRRAILLVRIQSAATVALGV